MYLYFNNFIYEFWKIILDSAPWLIIGFLIAGLLHSYVPVNLINKHIAKKGLLSIIKSSLFGIPIPLCSCSVIPVSRTLSLNGASKGATAAFMTSTPQIGIDSFLLTKGLLGLPIAIIRIVAAFISSIFAGLLVEKFSTSNQNDNTKLKENCCCSNNTIKKDTSSFLKFSFYDLPKDLSKPLLIGFIISALISSFFPTEFLSSSISNPNIQMIISLLISIPTYVCATSSTPIAVALISKGLSPGAALVFLLAGPATNSATILAAKNDFGSKAAIAYVISILIVSLLTGFLVQNYFELDYIKELLFMKDTHIHAYSSYTNIFSGIFLLAILIYPIFKK